MNVLRLKKENDKGGSAVFYTQGFFGGLFRKGIYLDRTTLRQYFKGEVPDEIEIEVRLVVHDEMREEFDRDLRARMAEEKRREQQEKVTDMHLKGALERLRPKS